MFSTTVNQSDPVYLPIVLEFVSAIESSTNIVSSLYSGYTMLITQEASTNYGPKQALPQTYTIDIPTNGIVKLKLLVLGSVRDKQAPIDRYIVRYYVGQELLDMQYWRVPHLKLSSAAVTISNDGSGEGVIIPGNLYEPTSIEPDVPYSIVDNLLFFDNTAPIGEYSLHYQPALTLQDIVVTC